MKVLGIDRAAGRRVVRVLVSTHELSVIRSGFGFGLAFLDQRGVDIAHGVERDALRAVADVLRAASDAARAGGPVEGSCRTSPELELEATSSGEGGVSLEMSRSVARAIENALTCVRGWTSEADASTIFSSDLDELFALIVGMRNAQAALVEPRGAKRRRSDDG